MIKKVREHHRKKRKELKKLGKHAPKEKDPGIPSQWPFKEELVKELAWKRQQILMEERLKKEERRAARAKEAARAEMEEDGAASELAELRAGAAAAERDFDTRKRARLTAGEGGGGGKGDNGERGAWVVVAGGGAH